MKRPTELQLVLNESYPANRLITDKVTNNQMVVHDMTQMANFVYNYYIERVKQMKNYYEVRNQKAILNFPKDIKYCKTGKWQKYENINLHDKASSL